MSKKTTSLRDGLTLNDQITNLADALIKSSTADLGAGKIVVDKKFYEESLPEGVTMAQVRKIEEHNSNLITAATLAIGELAQAPMTKDKELASLSMRIPVSRGRVDAQIKREGQIRNVQTGEVSPVYGVVDVKFRAAGTSTSSGHLKTVRDQVKTAYGTLFG